MTGPVTESREEQITALRGQTNKMKPHLDGRRRLIDQLPLRSTISPGPARGAHVSPSGPSAVVDAATAFPQQEQT